MELVRNAKLAKLLWGEESERLLRLVSEVSRRVPVYSLDVPRDLDLLPEVVDRLLEWHAVPQPHLRVISTTQLPLATSVPLAQRPTAIACDALVKSFPIRRSWREALRAPFATRWQLVTDHLSCDIAQGELFGLLGPNGAGKSTLMRMLATAVIPDAGTATIHGADVVADARAVRGMIGAAAANERAVLWRISARDNLRYFAALLGLRGAARTKRIEEVLELVELADTGEKMVGEFSSGMRQRLLIARALLGSPRVLLLDEPTRSLDPISARQFRRFMTRLIREETKCTVVLATHSTEEAMELCDRVGVLDRGRLLAVGRPGGAGRRADAQQLPRLARLRCGECAGPARRARRGRQMESDGRSGGSLPGVRRRGDRW